MALPKTTFEQRFDHYADFVSLLKPGFLTATLSIDAVFVGLRSLSSSDWFLLQHRMPSTAPSPVFKRWVVAQSIWMLHGTNVLIDTNVAPSVYKALRRLPARAMDRLFFVVVGLNKRAASALDGVEAFSYENFSRHMWLQLNGSNISYPHSTGVQGTDLLGLNSVQQMWTAANVIQDKKETQDLAWAEAKLIASASSPKGVEKLNQKDANTLRSEHERRQQVRDQFYYRAIKVLDPENKVRGQEQDNFTGASSPDELAEEMRKWVTGEQDHHDSVVQSYKDRIIAGFEAAEKERLRRIDIVKQELKIENIDEPLKLVGFTPEQMQDRIAKRQEDTGRVGGVGHVGYSDGRSYLYDRYLERKPDSGVLRDSGGKLTDQKTSTLNQQIADRQVLAGGEPDGDQ